MTVAAAAQDTALPQLSVRPPNDLPATGASQVSTPAERAAYLSGVQAEARAARGPAPQIPSVEIEVKPGDSLESLAAAFGTTIGQLAQLNPDIRDLDNIRAGDTLNVPVNRQVVQFQPGDRLSELADRYGVSVNQLARTNGITNPDQIQAGDRFAVVPPVTYGLDRNSQVTQFIEDVRALQPQWASMTPGERATALGEALNDRLNAGGVPDVRVRAGGVGTANGVYDFTTNTIGLDPALLTSSNVTDAQLRDVADTLWHEGRHAEQWFDMARVATARGDDLAGLQMDAGFSAAAAAAPALDLDSARGNYAEAMFESVYGTGSAHRNSVLSNITAGNYEQYRALPEEADAWRVGGKVLNLWPR